VCVCVGGGVERDTWTDGDATPWRWRHVTWLCQRQLNTHRHYDHCQFTVRTTHARLSLISIRPIAIA